MLGELDFNIFEYVKKVVKEVIDVNFFYYIGMFGLLDVCEVVVYFMKEKYYLIY